MERPRHRILALIAVVLIAGGCTRDPLTDRAPVYEWRTGDTLTAVARAWKVEVRTIAEANDLTAFPRPGQILRIPGGVPPAEPVPAPVVEPVAAKPAPAPAPADWYHPRSAWTQLPVTESASTPMSTPFRITVHHSAMPGDTTDPTTDLLAKIEREHRKMSPPWACIGYHFIIDRDGEVWEGRPLRYQGAHAHGPERNRGNIGVCLLGNFDRVQVPRPQALALVRVLDRLRDDHAIARSQIFGHCEIYERTECPGRHLLDLVHLYTESLGEAAARKPALRATAVLAR